MGFGNGGLSAQGLFQGAMTGLAQGVASIGLNYLTEEFDLNPLLANMGFSAIATLINAGIQTGFSEEDDDIFNVVYKTYEKNVLTMLGYADPSDPDYLWKQAAYVSQILDFSDIIEQQGLEVALNTYATSFFNSTAVNAIASSGLTIGRYFVNQLPEIVEGIQEAILSIYDGVEEIARAIFDVNENNEWELTGVEYDDSKIQGELGVDSYGQLGIYAEGELQKIFGDYTINQIIENSEQTYMEVLGWDGNIILIVEPKENGGANYYNSYGEYIDAKLTDILSDQIYTFDSDYDIAADLYTNLQLPFTFSEMGELLGFESSVLPNSFVNLDVDFNTANDNISFNISDNTNIPSTNLYDRLKESILWDLKETRDMFEGILSMPNVAVAEEVGNLMGSLTEMFIGGTMISGAFGVEGITLGAATPVSIPVFIGGSALVVKGGYGASESISSLWDLLVNPSSPEEEELKTMIGEAYNVVDEGVSFYEGIDVFRNLDLNSFGLGSTIIKAMRLYVTTYDYFIHE